MDDQDQWVDDEYLVDVDAARPFARELVDGVPPAPGRLKVLRGAADELNNLALAAARAQDLDYAIQFRAWPKHRGQMPPADAYETGWEPDQAPELVGYELVVSVAARDQVEDHIRRLPEIRARREERQRQRALERGDVLRRRRWLRGPHRRGTGRVSHRRPPRANAPPADDDDGEAEPEPLARRCHRRASCCQGRRR